MSKEANRIVRFTTSQGGYNSGELAGFPKTKAQALVDSGAAVFHTTRPKSPESEVEDEIEKAAAAEDESLVPDADADADGGDEDDSGDDVENAPQDEGTWVQRRGRYYYVMDADGNQTSEGAYTKEEVENMGLTELVREGE